MKKDSYSLWGNGGGDDVLIIDNVSPLEAALELEEQDSQNHDDGWNYFLVLPSRTGRCKARGNVNNSDIATAKIPNLRNTDVLYVCDHDGKVREHKHCVDCSPLSVAQILLNRLDYSNQMCVEEARGF